MNFSTVLNITLLSLLVLFIIARIETRARWVAWVFVALPSVAAAGVWAVVFEQWREALAGLGLALVAMSLWWVVWGRALPPTSSDGIKVWGQDSAPKPKAADLAAMQAEIMRLQDEKARMEAEIKQLREKDGG